MKLSNNLLNERLEEQLAAVFEIGETAPATAVVEDQAALRAPSRVGILFTFERLISVLLGLGILDWIGFHLGNRRIKC